MAKRMLSSLLLYYHLHTHHGRRRVHCDEREWFCHGAVQVRYVCYKVYSFFPIIHYLFFFSPCRRSLHKKNFSVSKFRMSLASMLYSRLDMFISLWTFHLFEEFLNFWREKKKRGNLNSYVELRNLKITRFTIGFTIFLN